MKGIIEKIKATLQKQDESASSCYAAISSIFEKRDILIKKATEKESNPQIRKKKMRAAEDYTAKMLQEVVAHCKLIYDEEAARENSILQQASNMQSAFSFITAGLFIIAQIVTDQLGQHSDLSYKTIFINFAITTACLLLSLIFATIAQSRFLRSPRKPILQYIQEVADQYYDLQDESQRIQLSIQEYEGLYNSLHRNNNIRVAFVRLSMWSFSIAIGYGAISGIVMAIIDGLK